jgi:hypothetical protein
LIVYIVMTSQSGTIHISFNSKSDKDKGFFELIQTSGSGFTGIGINEFIITEEQSDLLKNKHINFNIINQSATTQSIKDDPVLLYRFHNRDRPIFWSLFQESESNHHL